MYFQIKTRATQSFQHGGYFSRWPPCHAPFWCSSYKKHKKMTMVVNFHVMLIYIILWYDVRLIIEFLYIPMQVNNSKWPPIDRKYTKNRTDSQITHFFLGFCYMTKNKRCAEWTKLTGSVLFFKVSPIWTLKNSKWLPLETCHLSVLLLL